MDDVVLVSTPQGEDAGTKFRTIRVIVITVVIASILEEALWAIGLF